MLHVSKMSIVENVVNKIIKKQLFNLIPGTRYNIRFIVRDNIRRDCPIKIPRCCQILVYRCFKLVRQARTEASNLVLSPHTYTSSLSSSVETQ